ncbi:unnamed protein product [Effrenium voratum]|nr:unnamed protein product [Effrenium voratum]
MLSSGRSWTRRSLIRRDRRRRRVSGTSSALGVKTFRWASASCCAAPAPCCGRPRCWCWTRPPRVWTTPRTRRQRGPGGALAAGGAVACERERERKLNIKNNMGLDSFSILFCRRSFQTPIAMSRERRIPGKNGEVTTLSIETPDEALVLNSRHLKNVGRNKLIL